MVDDLVSGIALEDSGEVDDSLASVRLALAFSTALRQVEFPYVGYGALIDRAIEKEVLFLCSC